MGGLLTHAPALCAITNPSTNSYKRLVPGFEAPVTIGYAMANRSAVIRIPAYAKTPETKRFELRNPDATCNPYYAYAAILMAGLDGIAKKIDPHEKGWGPYDFNLYDLSDEEKSRIAGLPKNLGEAIEALEKDHDFLTAGGVFPERLISQLIEIERRDMEQISFIPHPAEFAMYYDL
jgi:glutamine synthetase